MTGVALNIRLARDLDVLPLARLYADAVRAAGPAAYAPSQVAVWTAFAEQADAFREFILRPRTFVAEDASGPLGFCGLEPDGHIASVYVRGDRLREGIGTRLLQAAIAHAEQSGIERLFAEASEFSRPLFLKVGFQAVGAETVNRDGVTFIRHQVERRLSRANG